MHLMLKRGCASIGAKAREVNKKTGQEGFGVHGPVLPVFG